MQENALPWPLLDAVCPGDQRLQDEKEHTVPGPETPLGLCPAIKWV